MARLSSAGLMFMLETGDRTEHDATAISKANPPVITMADTTGIVAGDHIVIRGTGFKSADDRVAKVGTVTSTTLQALGLDTTDEAGTAETPFTFEVVTLEETCLAGVERTPGTPSDIDVTTLCDVSRRRVSGLPDSGTFTMNGFYDASDAGYLRLVAASKNPNRTLVIGLIPSDKSEVLFQARGLRIGESAAVDQAFTFSGGGTVDGEITYVPPPA